MSSELHLLGRAYEALADIWNSAGEPQPDLEALRRDLLQHLRSARSGRTWDVLLRDGQFSQCVHALTPDAAREIVHDLSGRHPRATFRVVESWYDEDGNRYCRVPVNLVE